MGSIFGRRANIAAIVIAGAIFFTALGFFAASGIDRPNDSKAAGLWQDGTGLTAEMAAVPSFAPIAEKMRPTVVHILVNGKRSTADLTPDSNPDNPDGGNGLPESHPPLPPEFEQTSEGSGVIISADGYILTNQHVIADADTITVTLVDGRSFDGRVVGSDGRDDLALVKIEPDTDLQLAPLGDSDKIRAGEWVMAMGNPLGFEYSVTVGVVSGKGRELPSTNFADFIQTDAAIYPGNSGGPLFNLAGEVIGINTAVIPDTNLGFAVPINSAKEILPQLLEKGRVVRGYLGVSIQPVEYMQDPPSGVSEGAAIAQVSEGTPAANAGLAVGDVIVAFDGTPVASPRGLTSLVTATSPGTRVPVSVVRGADRIEVDVVVGSLPTDLE
ncbi:MAG TPA: trypsin-like peptidase domain-containing protein [Thermoleophilia bacterium]|nr:trypsin-like peptidase domain-containing protein [Thermoleophilia bacterium]